ncbi:hypothetical protein PVT71_11185 [Salipiger sp. H15]|uniref:Uncharacterized protein n=1 Tax=Alloyangia sp. H15 TaxID=3029062 RepID=A0AAU8ADS6_9RHOB
MRDTPPETAAREALLGRGRMLARQERWRSLAEALREADLSRSRTPGGTPAACLLCEGAVQDAMTRAAEAVARGDPGAARTAVLGFAGPLGPTTEAPWHALLAAAAHLAAARLWHAADAGRLPAPHCLAAEREHMDTAHLILRPHDPSALGSAALAAARCATLAALPWPEARVAGAYEVLIAAEPGCPDHLRAYGLDLAPGRFGTWPELDRAARRIAMLTGDPRRLGGYAWVWLDVLARHPEGFAHVEAELFVAGLHDILRAWPEEAPDQHLANLFAAWCAARLAEETAPSAARARIGNCLGWIVTDQLREIHPALWTCPGAADAGLGADGAARAQAVLADLFAHQLARGRRVIFTAAGVTLQPGGCASCTLAPCAALAYPRRNLRDEDPPCLT